MNQIPNIEEEIRHFCNAFAMTMPPSNEMMQATRNLRKQLPSFIHQQLQKAREEERERIKKDLDRRLEIQKKVSSSEYEGGYTHALQDVKEAYQSELDQPTV